MEKDLMSEHRRRVKDKFLQNGFPEGTNDYEYLEFLLFFAIPRKDTKEIAKLLLKQFGSLSGVFNAPISELQKVEGVGEHAAILIKIIPEIARAYKNDMLDTTSSLNSVEEIGTYLLNRYAYFGKDEVFSILSFDNKGKLLSFNVVEKGDTGSVGVSARKVIEIMLTTKASSAVIAHNHPGGIALPSSGDLKVTETLKRVLNDINVQLLDHIIIAGDDFVSLLQSKEFTNIFK